jgi:hypothetical protein
MNRIWLLSLLVVGLMLPGQRLSAETAKTLVHYQGYLTDLEETPVSGSWTLTFSFFADQTGGAAFFVESQTVEVTDGVFSVSLGAKPNLAIDPLKFQGGIVWLEVSVTGDLGDSMVMQPRQRVTSQPFSMWSGYAETCGSATNAISLGGKSADAFVTLDTIGNLCLGAEDLNGLLAAAGYQPGDHYSDADAQAYLNSIGVVPGNGYGDDDVAAFLLANGYEPGPYFSGLWQDLQGAPDVGQFVTKTTLNSYVSQANVADVLAGDTVKNAMAQKGVFLMADGSVAAKGNLDFAGNQLLNVVVQNSAADKAPANPQKGQLWYDSTGNFLKVYDGTKWSTLGTIDSINLNCQGCVDPQDVSFNYAGAAEKGGAAFAALSLVCDGCVDAQDIGINWAMASAPGGEALSALDINCDGCVTLGDLAADVLRANNVKYDNSGSGLVATTIQAAIDELAKQGPSNVVEGNGTVVSHMGDWSLKGFASGTMYMHLMNPATPKVIAYLYGLESMEFTSAADSVVTADTALNEYGYNVTGTAGQTSLNVATNGGVFKAGDRVLIYQQVGTGNNGTNAGRWELAEVKAVSGTTFTLAAPLKNSYFDNGPNDGQSQVVKAATYNSLEVRSGGILHPSTYLEDAADRGGIVYIRSNTVTVRSGGKIHADGYGFESVDSNQRPGDSECAADRTNQHLANCAGGGAGYPSGNCGGGGGGNKTAGKDASLNGCPQDEIGRGGLAKGAANTDLLTMGGAGGNAVSWNNSSRMGNGGGLVVIGAKTMTIEAGGIISANGMNGQSNICGGGAGGTVALFVDKLTNGGTLQALGGKGHVNGTYAGGDGGDGWVQSASTIAGVVETAVPMGVEIWVDGNNVTNAVGDPNGRSTPHWDATNKKWGQTGTLEWNSGPLDLTNVATWGLGEHNIQLRETGGVGGLVKMYAYVVYPFTKAAPPTNDTCATATTLNVMGGHLVVSGTTEDLMGKIKANDDLVQPFCGGAGGADVVYKFELTDWRHLKFDVSAAFEPRFYIRKDNCTTGKLVACGSGDFEPDDLKPGVYYLVVDSDGNSLKGNFNLTIDATIPGPPPNDTCANPAELIFNDTGKAERYGVNLFSTNDYSAYCGGGTGLDNVFKFSIPAGVTKFTATVTSDFNPVIYIANGTCTTTSLLTCVPGKTYSLANPAPGDFYLFVDGKTAADKGEYTVTVTIE